MKDYLCDRCHRTFPLIVVRKKLGRVCKKCWEEELDAKAVI